LVEFLYVPPSADQVLRLDLACAYLAVLRALFDISDQLFLLILKFDPLPVEFALCLFKRTLMLAKSLRGGHALAESPFYDLAGTLVEYHQP
jgi:hypothetical protein